MFSENLKNARKNAGYSQKELAKLLFVSQQAVAKWEVGTSTPSPEMLSKIAELLNVSSDYILGRSEGALESVIGKASPGAVRIPVLGRVAAGIPLYAVEEIIDWEETPEQMTRGGEEYFGLKIKGRSMEPRICDGDVVIVRRQQTCDNGSIAIILVNGNEATCKRVKFTEQGMTLIASNAEFEPIFYTKQEIEELPVEILGVVVELRGKFA